jgi:hypothetical protein
MTMRSIKERVFGFFSCKVHMIVLNESSAKFTFSSGLALEFSIDTQRQHVSPVMMLNGDTLTLTFHEEDNSKGIASKLYPFQVVNANE